MRVPTRAQVAEAKMLLALLLDQARHCATRVCAGRREGDLEATRARAALWQLSTRHRRQRALTLIVDAAVLVGHAKPWRGNTAARQHGSRGVRRCDTRSRGRRRVGQKAGEASAGCTGGPGGSGLLVVVATVVRGSAAGLLEALLRWFRLRVPALGDYLPSRRKLGARKWNTPAWLPSTT